MESLTVFMASVQTYLIAIYHYRVVIIILLMFVVVLSSSPALFLHDTFVSVSKSTVGSRVGIVV